jgi:hypothetical protein
MVLFSDILRGLSMSLTRRLSGVLSVDGCEMWVWSWKMVVGRLDVCIGIWNWMEAVRNGFGSISFF